MSGGPETPTRQPVDTATMVVGTVLVAAPAAIITAAVGWWWQRRLLHRPRRLAAHLAGAAVTTIVVLVVFGGSYVDTWVDLVRYITGTKSVQPLWITIVHSLMLGAPVGWLLGIGGHWWWDIHQSKHPINGRAHRAHLLECRQRLLAYDIDRRRIPLTRNAAPVIGGLLAGEPDSNWISDGDVILPADVSHLVAIGASGAGKTESLLRLAAAHLELGWQVIVIDAKEDPDTGERLARHACSIGLNPQRVRTWPAAGPIDLCRGDGMQIHDRFMACGTYSEAYYQAVASTILRLACTDPTGVPRTLRELVSRVDGPSLKTRWAGTDNASTASNLGTSDIQGVRYRYSNLASNLEQIGAISDRPGGWSWDDTDVAWVTLPTSTQTATAAALGRALLVDLISFIRDPQRRPRMNRPILLIVEELGAIVSGDPATAQLVVEAFERARSANVRAVVSVQTVHGLGDPPTQARILHSGASVLAHRMPHPEDITELLGTRYGFEASLGVTADGSLLDKGSLREQHTFVLPPATIRQLPTGQAVLIHRTNWAHIKVPRVAVPT